MSRRRLYYLLDVGRLIVARELSRAVAEAIGWTKLQIITRHMLDRGGASDEEFDSFLKSASSTENVRHFRQVLQGDETTVTKAAVFHLAKGDKEKLNKALLAFGAKKAGTGLANKESALMQLVKVALASKS